MAQFDMSKTVQNILSARGDTAQASVVNVVKTTSGLMNLPGVNMEKLADLPVVPDTVVDVGRALGLPTPEPPVALTESPPNSRFSQFDSLSLRGAVAMASKMMEIADRKGGDAGLADAVGAVGALGEIMGELTGLDGDLNGDLTAEVAELVGQVRPEALGMVGLRQYALRLFTTHYPPARERFRLGPVEVRQPNLVSRSTARATPPEDRVSFWREDALLNDHHDHWHIIYPSTGRPVAGGDPDMGDRHGELFVYMHQQMLARYDAERLGVGLPRVKPFDDYRASIPEGYDPGNLMGWFDGQWMGFSPRPANATISDLAPPAPDFVVNRLGAKITDMERFRDALSAAANQGWYDIAGQRIAVTSDNLGNTEEANTDSVDWPVNPPTPAPDPRNGTNLGNHHNDGHMHFAFFDDSAELYGVMAAADVNVRDPVFWRWHKHIDDIIQKWRVTLGGQEPHDFTDGPPVTVRNKDIILCNKNGIPAGFDSLDPAAAGSSLRREAFGYWEGADAAKNRWDADFSSSTVTHPDGWTVTTTAELMTEMRTRTILVRNPDYDPQGGRDDRDFPEEVDYLSHEDFFYFLRLQNRSRQTQQVTVRIFLAPEPWVEDINAWIEMDRFQHRLAGRERAVVSRPARLSAVIRKLALGHEELESAEPPPPGTTWCDCGWPYNLLLPRGTKEGLEFRLLVMLSSGDLVMTDTSQECTSMSYCGLQDLNYPDRRPMGYPFDRSLPDCLSSIVEKHENWASRTIKIRCRNP